jgi:hypothetical protein
MREDHDDSPHHTWIEYRELVLKELERLNESINILNIKIDKIHTRDISDMKIRIAMLEVRAGVWGAIAGCITGIGFIIVTKIHL